MMRIVLVTVIALFGLGFILVGTITTLIGDEEHYHTLDGLVCARDNCPPQPSPCLDYTCYNTADGGFRCVLEGITTEICSTSGSTMTVNVEDLSPGNCTEAELQEFVNDFFTSISDILQIPLDLFQLLDAQCGSYIVTYHIRDRQGMPGSAQNDTADIVDLINDKTSELAQNMTEFASNQTRITQLPTREDVDTLEPTASPTSQPTKSPTRAPSESPTKSPTKAPTKSPTRAPSKAPTESPTKSPTKAPSESPTEVPTKSPTRAPSEAPTESPTTAPSEAPTESPTKAPTGSPTASPIATPLDPCLTALPNPTCEGVLVPGGDECAEFQCIANECVHQPSSTSIGPCVDQFECDSYFLSPGCSCINEIAPVLEAADCYPAP